MTRYKTKYGLHPTLEAAAAALGVSIERAEEFVLRGTGDIKLVTK